MLEEYIEKTNLKEFLKNLDVPAYIVDRARRIIFWNDAAKRLTGYEAKDVIGLSCADNTLKHIDRNGIVVCTTELCPLIMSMKTGRYVRVPFAVYSLTKDKKRIPVSVYAYPLKNEEGNVIGAVEMFEDATQSDADLTKAFTVQRSLLPRPDDMVDFLWYPSNLLGGDMIYYRYPWVMLVDVSGHGVASALVSVTIKMILDSLLSQNDLEISHLPVMLEKEFLKYKFDNYFTVIMGKVNGKFIDVVSCGHPEPIIYDGKEAKKVDVPRTFPVGMGFIEEPVEPVKIDVSGKSLLFYSDGIIEINVDGGKMLGVDGLVEIFERTQNLSEIYRVVMEMNRAVFQGDDISLLKIKL